MSATDTLPFRIIDTREHVFVPVSLLDHRNYRSEYVESHVVNLATLIARDGLAVLPAARRESDGTWLVVDGNTRIVAMRDHLGATVVPVREFVGDDRALLLAQVAENEQRRETSGADRARVARRLRDEHGCDLAMIGETLSASAHRVRDLLILADRLTDRSLEAWSDGLLTLTQALELARCDRDRQSAVVDLARSSSWSAKAFSALIERIVAAQIEDGLTGLFSADAFTLQVEAWADDVRASEIRRPSRAALEAELAGLRAIVGSSGRFDTHTATVTRPASGAVVDVEALAAYRGRLVFGAKLELVDAIVEAHAAGAPWPTCDADWYPKVVRALRKCGVVA